MGWFIEHVKQTAREDCRIFFVPFKGALDGIKEELRRPQPRTFSEKVKQDVRLYFAPFAGAIKGVREELRKTRKRMR